MLRKSMWRGLCFSLASAIAFAGLAMPAFSAPAEEAANQASAEPAAAKGSIKIGYVIPLSGVGESGGKQMLQGMNLYLDQIHRTMAGKKVELLVENNESSPATELAKIRKLVDQDKANLLAGGFFAHILYKTAPLVEELKIPYVDVVSGADDITQRKRGKWLIRISWTSSQLSHPFGDWVAKTLKYKRVITIAADYAYGYEVVGGFQKSFEQAGGQVVQKLWVPMGFSDFKPFLKQIRPDADAVFMTMVGPQGELIANQYHEMGIKMPIIGVGGTQFDESSLQKDGAALLGAIHCNPYVLALDTPQNKRFLKEFRDKYNEDPGFFAECGYVAAMWIHRAVDSLHGDVSDRNRLLTALKRVELKDAPRGPTKLDAYGSVIDNIYVTKVVSQNGNYINKVIHTFPMVSEFWTWKPEEYMKQPPYDREFPPCTHCAAPTTK